MSVRLMPPLDAISLNNDTIAIREIRSYGTFAMTILAGITNIVTNLGITNYTVDIVTI